MFVEDAIEPVGDGERAADEEVDVAGVFDGDASGEWSAEL